MASWYAAKAGGLAAWAEPWHGLVRLGTAWPLVSGDMVALLIGVAAATAVAYVLVRASLSRALRAKVERLQRRTGHNIVAWVMGMVACVYLALAVGVLLAVRVVAWMLGSVVA